VPSSSPSSTASMSPHTRARTISSSVSLQSSKSDFLAATPDAVLVSCVPAWAPFQSCCAEVVWVRQPGDYAKLFPNTSATEPMNQTGRPRINPSEDSTRLAERIHRSVGTLPTCHAFSIDAALRAILPEVVVEETGEGFSDSFSAMNAEASSSKSTVGSTVN